MFLFQTAQKTAPGPQAQDALAQQIIPFEKFTPKMREWLSAAKYAAGKFREHISVSNGKLLSDERERPPHVSGSAPKNSCVYFGPAIDQSYDTRIYVHDESITARDILIGMKTALECSLPLSNLDIDYLKNPANFADAQKDALAMRREILAQAGAQGYPAISDPEFHLVCLINSQERLRFGEENGKVMVFKHFPFGVLEGTHNDEIQLDHSLSELKARHFAVFETLMRGSGPKPPAFMVSWGEYLAEAELKGKYDFASIFPKPAILPASFSPWIVKGLLRKEYGFEGLVVSDSCSGMSAVRLYLQKNRALLPAEFKGWDYTCLEPVLLAYAGVNWALDLDGNNQNGRFKDAKAYFAKSPEFRKIFNDLGMETLYLKLKLVPQDVRQKTGLDIGGLSFADLKASPSGLSAPKRAKLQKLRAALGSPQGNFDALCGMMCNEAFGTPKRLLPLIGFFSQHDDLANRSGLYAQEFRLHFVEALSGIKLKGRDEFRPRVNDMRLGTPGDAGQFLGDLAEYNKANGTVYSVDLKGGELAHNTDLSGSFYILDTPCASAGAANTALGKYNEGRKESEKIPLLDGKQQAELKASGAVRVPEGFTISLKGGRLQVHDDYMFVYADFTEVAFRREADKAWLDYLSSSKEFSVAYNGIDWNSLEMRSVFAECYARLADTKYPGTRADGIMKMVPIPAKGVSAEPDPFPERLPYWENAGGNEKKKRK